MPISFFVLTVLMFLWVFINAVMAVATACALIQSSTYSGDRILLSLTTLYLGFMTSF